MIKYIGIHGNTTKHEMAKWTIQYNIYRITVLVKPIAFLGFSLPSTSSLLKLRTVFALQTAWPWRGFMTTWKWPSCLHEFVKKYPKFYFFLNTSTHLFSFTDSKVSTSLFSSTRIYSKVILIMGRSLYCWKFCNTLNYGNKTESNVSKNRWLVWAHALGFKVRVWRKLKRLWRQVFEASVQTLKWAS